MNICDVCLQHSSQRLQNTNFAFCLMTVATTWTLCPKRNWLILKIQSVIYFSLRSPCTAPSRVSIFSLSWTTDTWGYMFRNGRFLWMCSRFRHITSNFNIRLWKWSLPLRNYVMNIPEGYEELLSPRGSPLVCLRGYVPVVDSMIMIWFVETYY